MRHLLNCAVICSIVFMLVSVRSLAASDIPHGHSKVHEPLEKDETVRFKILDENGNLKSRHVEFQDESREVQNFDSDQKLKERIRLDKQGQETSRLSYYPDGKLKREVRKGVLRFERRKLSDGTYEAIRYKSDGKSAQMHRRVGPAGEFELTHYRTGKSTKVWFSATLKGTSGDFEWSYFAEDGATLRRVISKSKMHVTVYDSSGEFCVEQEWSMQKDGSYLISSAMVKHGSAYRRYKLNDKGEIESVEDVDADGTVSYIWGPEQVDAPDAKLFEEQFSDDDPTVPSLD